MFGSEVIVLWTFLCCKMKWNHKRRKKSNCPIVWLFTAKSGCHDNFHFILFYLAQRFEWAKVFLYIWICGVEIFFFMNIINLCGCLQKDKIIRGLAKEENNNNGNNKYDQCVCLVRCVRRLAQRAEFQRKSIWNRDTNRKLRC